MDYSAAAAEYFDKMFANYKSGMLEQIFRTFKGENFILVFLSNGGVLIPSELSAEMGVSSARVAVVLRNLETKGYITREIDKIDHRKIRISITEAGKAKAEHGISEAQRNIEKVFREMGEEDTNDFIRTVESFLKVSSQLLEDQN